MEWEIYISKIKNEKKNIYIYICKQGEIACRKNKNKNKYCCMRPT